MDLPPTRTETPTQYDLARWLFQLIEEREGRRVGRTEILGLMIECMTAVRPERERGSKT